MCQCFCCIAEEAKAVSGGDAQPDDVAITLSGTQDASKLGRQVAPGESSSSSSSSSSDGQAEPFYNGRAPLASALSSDSFSH